MDKMRFESSDLSTGNIDKIAEMFPGVVTEGKVNFDLLRSLLGDEVYGDEAYEFTWVGKKAAIAEAGRPIRKTLRPCVEESKNWDTTENLYIEGDNLDVLKLLQESYLGKVKMIYIDPPYNTGNDLVYRDNFTRDKDKYDEEAGVLDEDGDRLFRNTESNGRFHSDWCSMMYPRLVLARNLLRDDGVIFISIDDGEVDNLMKLGNEVFGEVNFVACFPWRKRTAKSDVPFGVSQDYEWLVAYAKSAKFRACVEGGTRKYFETDDLPGRPWRIHDLTTQRSAQERPNSNYTMVNPKTGDEYPVNPNRVWAVTIDTFDRYYSENRIVFPGDYEFLSISKPAFRYFKEEDKQKAGDLFGFIPLSTNLPNEIGMSQDGTKDFDALFGNKSFAYPKPVNLIKYLIKSVTVIDKNALVLDFFSGSATTAHAVMQLNAEDGGKRKFIMVQLPEPCDEKSEAYKAGYANICEIGKERIRRAGEKINAEFGIRNAELKERVQMESNNSELDTGFRVLKLDSTNMRDVYYAAGEYTQDLLALMEDNIKDDRTDIDLLYACLLDWGLPLSMPHKTEVLNANGEVVSNSELGIRNSELKEKINSELRIPNSELFTIHTYNDGDLIACFDKHISNAVVKEIAKRQPLRAVFRDSSFASSPEKINVEEIFKLLAPNTSVRVI